MSRETMPDVAGFVDAMRDLLGREYVDGMIKRGMRGEPDCFYATEAGHSVGTPFRPDRGTVVTGGQMVLTPMPRVEKKAGHGR